jgi:hypothetical protein
MNNQHFELIEPWLDICERVCGLLVCKDWYQLLLDRDQNSNFTPFQRRDLCIYAAKHNYNNIIVWAVEHYAPIYNSVYMNLAQHGNLELLNWLESKQYPDRPINGGYGMWRYAIKRESIPLLYFVAKTVDFDQACLYKALCKGRMTALHFLQKQYSLQNLGRNIINYPMYITIPLLQMMIYYQIKFRVYPQLFSKAKREELEWLLARDIREDSDDSHHINRALCGDNYEFFKWAYHTFGWKPTRGLFLTAIQTNQAKKIITFLLLNANMDTSDPSFCKCAIETCNLPLLKWLVLKGCVLPTQVYLPSRQNLHWQKLRKWLIKQGVQMPSRTVGQVIADKDYTALSLLEPLAAQSYISIILINFSCEELDHFYEIWPIIIWTPNCYRSAIRENQLEKIKWLFDRQVPSDESAIITAALGGHYHILRFLLKNNFPWDPHTICKSIIGNFTIITIMKLFIDRGAIISTDLPQLLRNHGYEIIAHYIENRLHAEKIIQK